MEILKANYDLVVTAFTAGVLLLVGAPLPLWAVWATVAILQIVNRRRGGGRGVSNVRRPQSATGADELDKRKGDEPPFV